MLCDSRLFEWVPLSKWSRWLSKNRSFYPLQFHKSNWFTILIKETFLGACFLPLSPSKALKSFLINLMFYWHKIWGVEGWGVCCLRKRLYQGKIALYILGIYTKEPCSKINYIRLWVFFFFNEVLLPLNHLSINSNNTLSHLLNPSVVPLLFFPRIDVRLNSYLGHPAWPFQIRSLQGLLKFPLYLKLLGGTPQKRNILSQFF